MIHALHVYLLLLAIMWTLLCAAGVFAFKFNIGYAALFATIQTVGGAPFGPLFLFGIPICAVLAFGNFSKQSAPPPGVVQVLGPLHWPRWAWIFDNDDDGTAPISYTQLHPTWSLARCEFMWTAWRNSVANLRHVWGVSKVGRPLWYRTWTIGGKLYYAKAGWMSDGFPAFSAGAGKGF